MSSRVLLLMVLGGLLSSSATAQLSDATRSFYTARLADSAAGRFGTLSASPLVMVQPVPALDAVVVWDRLRRDAYPASFAEFALFLRDHADWPQANVIRRRAEKAIDSGVAPADRLAYFRASPPVSSLGRLRLAEALLAQNRRAEAVQAAREAWAAPGLDADGELQLLTNFEADLTPADHLARADRLLWAGQTSAAARLLPRLTMDRRLWLLARIACRVGAPDTLNRLNGVPEALRAEPGLLLDQAQWLKRTNAMPAARATLANAVFAPGLIVDPEQWLKGRLELARGAWRDGDFDTAFRLAARHAAFPLGRPLTERSLGERQQFIESEWLAGWLALRKLARPADAVAHFQNVRSAAQTPLSQTRGDYWTGRALDAAGRADDARIAYDAAAAHPDYFYGQLAAERLNRPVVLPPQFPLTPPPPGDERTLRFQSNSLVLAIRALGDLGDRGRQTVLLRHLADRSQTPDEQALVATLIRPLGRPDLGVMLGKAARSGGELALIDYAYPVVELPPSLAPRFAFIHALARQESQFDRAIVSAANARGLMQLVPSTAAEQAAKDGIPYSLARLTDDPIYNATLGSGYFLRIRDGLGGSNVLAVAAYNAGSGNARKFIALNGDPRTEAIDTIDWIESIPFAETRNYVQRVLENAVMYDLLHPQTAQSPGVNRLSWYLGKRTTG